MPKPRILIVDDDKEVRGLLKEILTNAGFYIFSAETGEEALLKVRQSKPDLVILDIALPGISGMKASQILKQDPETGYIPVILLSGKCKSASDISDGLNQGADDFITKPFSKNVLVARINALLRRLGGLREPEEILRAEKIEVNISTRTVIASKRNLRLTPKEFDLLCVLIRTKNRVLNRSFLLESVWGYEYFGTTRTVDKHIENLRKKLGPAGQIIETVPGVGYRLVSNE